MRRLNANEGGKISSAKKDSTLRATKLDFRKSPVLDVAPQRRRREAAYIDGFADGE